MTPIKIGTTDVANLYIGNTPIQKVYQGSNLIYELFSGSLKLLGDIEVTGSAVTNVNFSGLNVSKDKKLVLVADILNSSGVTNENLITVNGNDTFTNYNHQQAVATGSSPFGNRFDNSYIEGSLNGNRTAFIADLKIANNGYFSYQATGSPEYNSSGIVFRNRFGASNFTITNITSIKITALNANGIGIGSRFQLYEVV